MSKFFIPDIRYILFAFSVYIFWKTTLYFQINERKFKTPMLPVLVTLAFIIWVAENQYIL